MNECWTTKCIIYVCVDSEISKTFAFTLWCLGSQDNFVYCECVRWIYRKMVSLRVDLYCEIQRHTILHLDLHFTLHFRCCTSKYGNGLHARVEVSRSYMLAVCKCECDCLQRIKLLKWYTSVLYNICVVKWQECYFRKWLTFMVFSGQLVW